MRLPTVAAMEAFRFLNYGFTTTRLKERHRHELGSRSDQIPIAEGDQRVEAIRGAALAYVIYKNRRDGVADAAVDASVDYTATVISEWVDIGKTVYAETGHKLVPFGGTVGTTLLNAAFAEVDEQVSSFRIDTF